MTGHTLRAERIAVSYRRTPVLHGLDLTVRTGEVLGVTGPSGCGKTTLLRVLAGLLRPDTGTVRYDDAPVAPPAAIAMLAQHPRLVCNPRWTLERIIGEPAAIRGERAAIAEVAERAGLDLDLLGRYPAQVSGGQLQRACLARALVQRPRFLLCDEPTAMLDPIATQDVWLVLKQLTGDTGLVVVSHSPRLVATLADHVLTLG